MKEDLLKLIAQQIVDKTSPLVKARTMNIMDTHGIIIASSDSSRIGRLHSGAKEAVIQGKSVEININQIENYIGAKEGINNPIISEGKIIGVVGLYGNPEVVRETAALLSSTVTLMLEQYNRMRLDDVKKTIRDDLAALLLLGSKEHSRAITEQLRKLRIPLTFPITPLIFKNEAEDTTLSYRLILEKLLRKGIYRNDRDLLLQLNPQIYVLLYHGLFKKEKAQQLFSKCTIGCPVENFADLPYQTLLAMRLFETSNNSVSSYKDYNDYIPLFFSEDGYQYMENVAQLMTRKLQTIGPWSILTIQNYIQANGKIIETARRLGIHKNTCRYRIEKILSILELKDCQLLTILVFFKLILQADS